MRVLLADGHPKVRWALRTFLEAERGFVVIGEAPDLESLLSLARALHPDVILLEWELSGQPTGQALTALQELGLQTQVVVLSWQPGVEQTALDAGADFFVSKAGGPEVLETAMRRLAKTTDCRDM